MLDFPSLNAKDDDLLYLCLSSAITDVFSLSPLSMQGTELRDRRIKLISYDYHSAAHCRRKVKVDSKLSKE